MGGKSTTTAVMSSCTPRTSKTFCTMPSAHVSVSMNCEHSEAMLLSVKAENTPSEATSRRHPFSGMRTRVNSGSHTMAERSKSPNARDTAYPPGNTLRGPTSSPSRVRNRANRHSALIKRLASNGSSGLCSRFSRTCCSRSSGVIPSNSDGCGSINAPESPTLAHTRSIANECPSRPAAAHCNATTTTVEPPSGARP